MKKLLKSGLIRGLTVMFLSLTLTFGACNVIDSISGGNDDDNNLLLLAAAAAAVSQASTCNNTTGLVICIPPGLRF